MRGHLRKRGSSWAIVIDVGRDEEGKRRQKWITVTGNKKAAQRKLAELLNAVNTGAYIDPSKETVAEYLRRWLSTSPQKYNDVL